MVLTGIWIDGLWCRVICVRVRLVLLVLVLAGSTAKRLDGFMSIWMLRFRIATFITAQGLLTHSGYTPRA